MAVKKTKSTVHRLKKALFRKRKINPVEIKNEVNDFFVTKNLSGLGAAAQGSPGIIAGAEATAKEQRVILKNGAMLESCVRLKI